MVRDAAGVWVLSIDGLSAGSYTGKIVYVDQTGTHAQSEQMAQFILEEGIAPSPKPSATKNQLRRQQMAVRTRLRINLLYFLSLVLQL